jgi:hypothetical protein
MACDCITTVNAKLAERNTRLTEALVFGRRAELPTIMLQTEVIEKKRGARPTSMFLTYCPFCGTKYEAEAEQAA